MSANALCFVRRFLNPSKKIFARNNRVRVLLLLPVAVIIPTNAVTSEDTRQGAVTSMALLAAQNARYVQWYPPDFQNRSHGHDVHGITKPYALWYAMHPCTSEAFRRADYPVMNDEARRSAVDPPAHGTAVVTMTRMYNSRQQHTFHKYYARHLGAENLYVGIHIGGECEMNHVCNITKAVREFHPTPTMIKMMSMGSKLIAAHCGEGHHIGQTTTDFANLISKLLRDDYGYANVIFAEDDEFLVPDPDKYPKGLAQYISEFSAQVERDAGVRPWRRAHGFNVKQSGDESVIDRSQPILRQRNFWRVSDPYYCKTMLTRATGTYGSGGHSWTPEDPKWLTEFGPEKVSDCDERAESDILLIHLKCVDKEQLRDQAFREFVIEHRVENTVFGMTNASTRYSVQFEYFFESLWARSLEECGAGTHVVYDDREYSRTLLPIPLKWRQYAGI
ncbi:hypothetical protein CYMTET_55059 [Cymbomonas tetramitiformis]|uniref:Uncharacterized protein n=1 Tax=Cymbomonas tetramitiformis TaxID=36881 RepID=A0AAE0BDD3_9CHLO|nr:hypothetical protein CYMTET_55059 [Cymbomonas tetramitiformis]|eukprot:gene312-571_t